MTIHEACDYVIQHVLEGRERLNHLKLQKLVYYVQAWHLAFSRKPLFEGKFQAWVHGPVSRELYDRFAATKSLYSPIEVTDVQPGFDPDMLPEQARDHINSVLEVYAALTDAQLETMTHRERPWKEARQGYRPSQRCEVELSETTMTEYYEQVSSQ